MQVIFRNCGFVRFPAFGTVSGQHLECVQRFLFALFRSNFLVQSFSNSRFWLKESDFGLNKWCQICFWTKLPPKPESSIQLKSFIFWTVVDRNPTQKGLASTPWCKINLKLLTFQSLLRVIRGIWCLILSAPLVNISNGKNAAKIQNLAENWRFWQLLY